MRYLTPALVIAAALTLSAPTAHAIPMTFVGNLSGANEVPPTTSTGTGLATIVLDPTAQTITFNVTFSGLTFERYGGAHPLLRAARHECRGRYSSTRASWLPFRRDLRDLHQSNL